MKTVSAFLAGLLLLAANTAWADAAVYKWVDSKGVVHYSTDPKDVPQAQQTGIVNKGNVVTSTPAPSTAPAPTSATGGKPSVAIGPNDSALCKSAKNTLNGYLGADYLYTLGPNGEKQMRPADQHAAQIATARAQVAKACGGGG